MIGAGAALSARRTVSDDDIAACARLTGDFGAHHIGGVAGRKVAQGLLTLSGTPLLADDGVHVTGMDLRFLAPVFAGDEITTSVTVDTRDGADITFTVVVTNATAEVLRGTGTARVLDQSNGHVA
ncbi:MaoC/PaaZ C-terminal domain-containing protein [Actinokineospora terrae]|uniref:Acyl dehydratase n=1 Tax=Actinokineospora terrae TaxID=155974 RepID=A0A1H9XUA6_9PSEU|nr:MaoC/PaaZ C-terminal domain-containing protein [Actinokineospora terrae]SES49263.1 Acyl dehydratase [Actinokineospora terrae]